MTSSKQPILIIGAGSAGSVVIEKCLQNPTWFPDIHVATHNLDKLNQLKQDRNWNITTHHCNADHAPEVAHVLRESQASLVINMALPYQDLAIMDACLDVGVHYIDTANYEPKDEAKFCYKWQD